MACNSLIEGADGIHHPHLSPSRGDRLNQFRGQRGTPIWAPEVRGKRLKIWDMSGIDGLGSESHSRTGVESPGRTSQSPDSVGVPSN